MVRLGLTLAVIGATIGIGGIIYAVLWLLAASTFVMPTLQSSESA